MALRQIRIDGDPILRKKARKINEINDRTKILLDDMIETMDHEKGVGLAAPQVGILRRAVVIDMKTENFKPLKMVNPVIVNKSEELQINPEGCLSVPNKSGYVKRPKWVEVEYYDENGQKQNLLAEGYFAVCVNHELDHLEGILYTDKVLDESDEDLQKYLDEMEEYE